MSFFLVPEKIFVFTALLTAVKSSVKTNVLSGTKKIEIYKSPSI